MKAEIILTLLWASACLSVRQQRSTVLTDESKRVVEHFDFSNFDKQEALNYIDRQRFENQIRGKRSHTKRDHKGINQNDQTDPESIKTNELPTVEENNPEFNSEFNSEVLDNCPSEDTKNACQSPFQKSLRQSPRNRRGHRLKKKRKYKADNYEEPEPDSENEENVAEEKCHRKRKKSKKKKKKKRKKKRHYWDKWSAWSPCSVTCGRGRRIRWRKCIVKNCTTGELEMGEKTCQLPACNLLTKILGLGGH